MQAIDNLTRLRGHILKRRPHPTRSGYELVTLQVRDTQAVEGKADLLSCHPGSMVDVAVPSALLQAAPGSPGDLVDLRAKMTPDGAMAEPHPEPGQFSISPGPDIN